jgi:hypothetical protein
MVSPFTNSPPLATSDQAMAVLSQYFTTINAGDFAATARLFAADGVLYPPFEQEVVGQEAIATYLAAEVQAMQLFPLHIAIEPLEEDWQGAVTGTIQTSLFSVNVAWDFCLSAALQIKSVKIKLLAALPELLRLKQRQAD